MLTRFARSAISAAQRHTTRACVASRSAAWSTRTASLSLPTRVSSTVSSSSASVTSPSSTPLHDATAQLRRSEIASAAAQRIVLPFADASAAARAEQDAEEKERYGRHVVSVHASELDRSSLEKVMSNEASVLRVRGFVPPAVCAALTRFFWSREANAQPYTHELYDDGEDVPEAERIQQVYFGVDRIGVPFNSTYGHAEDSPQFRNYVDSALPMIEAIRASCSPLPTPVDMLRLRLDELSPNGAHVGAVDGHTMFCGIGRLMTADASAMSEEQPHFDAMPPASSFRYKLAQQFAANMYLDVPSTGGELEIWPVEPLAFDVIEDSDPDFDWRSHLPVDSIKVKPEQGDLLIFNTRRPHAITAFPEGSRTSMQCFLGVQQDEGTPLVMWN